MQLTRRVFFASIGASVIAPAAFASPSKITVYKDPSCGCCQSWIDIIRAEGFDAIGKDVTRESLTRFKLASGLPEDMTSCHTGVIDGYVIEGHVPPADIQRLLAERPEAIGLSVPGMPYGSPGMGPESEREAYSVYLIRSGGQVEVFSTYAAA